MEWFHGAKASQEFSTNNARLPPPGPTDQRALCNVRPKFIFMETVDKAVIMEGNRKSEGRDQCFGNEEYPRNSLKTLARYKS